jgi:ribosomal-protein-serine acetyltransferase
MFEVDVEQGIRLREIQMTDAHAIFQIIDRDREYMRVWLPFVDFTRIVEDTETFIKNAHAEPADRNKTIYIIMHKNQLAGLISFKYTDRANHKTELGYWLAQDQQGKGLVTKSCKALINLAFERMGMHRVQIRVSVDNLRSKSIPIRLGFKFEGIERDGEFLNGHYTDLEVYSILKNEWLHHNGNSKAL